MSSDRLLNLTASYFNVPRERLQLDADIFDTLGIDSVKALELITEIELEFDVEIPDYEMKKVKTFGDLVSVVTARA